MRGVSKGQNVAIYSTDICLGGGEITDGTTEYDRTENTKQTEKEVNGII